MSQLRMDTSSFYEVMAALFLVALFRYILWIEKQKKHLRQEKIFLSHYDALTGLLNYDGYTKSIENLVVKRISFTLITLDFQDFKTFNSHSVNSGNQILMDMSLKLKHLYPDAVCISRYAGDRFAIVIPYDVSRAAEIDLLMSVEILGFQVTYSVSHFPLDGSTASSLLSTAEDRLFQSKRDGWVLREELRFQEEKLKALGELAAGMAHEIRNPLTTIKGFLQISQNNNFDMKPWFHLVMGEITRMSELTAEFLQFAKPNSNHMKPEILQSCVDRALSLTESEASFRGHVILKEDWSEPITVLADQDKIVQVLLNLMRNAFEAMDKPGTVHVRLRQAGSYGLLQIEDSGSGMTDHEMSGIFNPFYTTKEQGTGLGLSISRKIIQDHGGSLGVNSKPGEGSVFMIKLPVQKRLSTDDDVGAAMQSAGRIVEDRDYIRYADKRDGYKPNGGT
jgi:signal transduction histidine kinase